MILKPVVQQYCDQELIRDSADFLVELKKMEDDETDRNIGCRCSISKYPSEPRFTGLNNALISVTGFSSDQVQMIIQFAEFCIKNSAVHFRGQWYKLLLGIPTGGPERGGSLTLLCTSPSKKYCLLIQNSLN